MNNEKRQILMIHGGTTFKSRKDYRQFLRTRKISIEDRTSWTGEYLKNKLGSSFDIIKPRMPLQDNAKYEEWRIHFERHIPFLRKGAVLIGSSLGGIFLAKYLSENKFPKKILSVYLVCPPFDNTLSGEDLVGGFKLKPDLSLIMKNCKNLNLLFSKDDETVTLAHAEKYRQKLSEANFVIFESMGGHFRVAEFPEIVKMIKSDINKNRQLHQS